MNKRRAIAAGAAALILVAALLAISLGGDSESDQLTPAAAATSYMRAQVTADPKACDLMTEEMRQQWIDSVTLSFEPNETPGTCDEATQVFIEWGKANDQVLPDPDTIKIVTVSVDETGDEATVKLRVELSETNKTETTLQLSRVAGRWLVSGTQAAL